MHRKEIWGCPIPLEGAGKAGRSFIIVPCFYRGKPMRDQRTGAFTCSGTFFPIAVLTKPTHRWYFTKEQRGATMAVVVYSSAGHGEKSTWIIWATKEGTEQRIDTQTLRGYMQMPCMLPVEDDRLGAINSFCGRNVAVALRPSWSATSQVAPEHDTHKPAAKKPKHTIVNQEVNEQDMQVDEVKQEAVAGHIMLTCNQQIALQKALDPEVCSEVSMTVEEVEELLNLGTKPGKEGVIPQYTLMKINRRLAKKGLLVKSGTRPGEEGLEAYYSLVKRTKLEDTQNTTSKKKNQTEVQDFSQIELVL